MLKYFNTNFNVEILVQIFQHKFQRYNLCWNITTEISTLKFVLHFQFTMLKNSTRNVTLKFVMNYFNTCRWIGPKYDNKSWKSKNMQYSWGYVCCTTNGLHWRCDTLTSWILLTLQDSLGCVCHTFYWKQDYWTVLLHKMCNGMEVCVCHTFYCVQGNWVWK